jgi:transcriptional regulator with XRE-family HTH domain
MNPAELLRQTRERHGLSQRRLAHRAGTTQAVVSRIERGVASPSVETLDRLLGAMGWELHVQAGRSRWQDHDAEALREWGALTPQQRLEGIEATIGEVAELHVSARTARPQR